MKRLDTKIENILNGSTSPKDFIIADAKDADMAFGIAATGKNTDGGRKTLAQYRDQIRAVIEQNIVDVMLLSNSTLEQLAIKEGLFEHSPITPAARANDTTDIWAGRGGKYPLEHPSRSFRTTTLSHIKYGKLTEDHSQKVTGADLGLYSITFTNNIDWDYKALQDFRDFRLDCERNKFRYFLEVFNPNVNPDIPAELIPGFLNDHIVRTLAGVPQVGRPLFLKIPYNGPEALEELVAYDPNLIVGILGGSAGTTLDAFQLIHDSQKYGARVALFGRKINLSESPLVFIELLRRVVDGEVAPAEGVKLYHSFLEKSGIRPHRSLQEDLELTPNKMSYR